MSAKTAIRFWGVLFVFAISSLYLFLAVPVNGERLNERY